MTPVPIPDRYEPVEIVGVGGQGHVIRARDRRHERDVAIKVRRAATEDERRALLAEARVLLTLDPHPNLPLAREDFFIDDRYCVVMDWIDGETLAAAMARDGRLPLNDVVDAIEQAARALDHMHTHDPPVLHLDVKPPNLIRRPDGRVVLVDLGLAGGIGGRYAGTPDYIAPEVARGEAPTPRSDVFALAVTAFELLTGTRPMPGMTPDWGALPARDVERLRAALRRGFATDPTRRPHGANDLAAAIAGDRTPNNLPADLSSFVGREDELAEIAPALGSTRCLTLVGAGGIGKTRIAIEAARITLGRYDAVHLVELASVDRDVDAHIAHALGVRDEGGRTPLEGVAAVLSRGTQLLLLDNCEHLIDEAARFTEDLLRLCAAATVLATSREPLRVTGETVWRVEPLTPEPAVALFTQRARSAAPRFGSLGEAPVSRICEVLDGIPLAIELAASLVGERSLDDIAAGLDDRLTTLGRGPRTLPRHETLLATMSWSYDLLEEADRDAFVRLSVFAGAFDDTGADAVCGADAAARIERLTDRSLCERSGTRSRMLEPVRRFAQDLLATTGRIEPLQTAHLDHHLALAVEASGALRSAGHTEALAKLDGAGVDLLAALDHATTTGRPADALRMCAALGSWWQITGRWTQGRRALERCLEAAGDDAYPSTAEAWISLGNLRRSLGDLDHATAAFNAALGLRPGSPRALLGLGRLRADHGDHTGSRVILDDALSRADDPLTQLELIAAVGRCEHFLGDLAAAGDSYRRAADIARRIGDDLDLGRLEMASGTVELASGGVAIAKRRFSDAISIANRLGDREGVATATAFLAGAHSNEGDQEGARLLYEESLDAFRSIGHLHRVAQTLSEMAVPVIQERDFAAGRALLTEAREIATSLRLDLVAAECVHKLSLLAEAEGDHAAAIVWLGEAVETCARCGDQLRLAMVIEHGTVIASALGDMDAALVMDAAGAAHRDRVAFPRATHTPVLQDAIDRAVAGALDAAASGARGAAMDLAQAVDYVRSWCASKRGT